MPDLKVYSDKLEQPLGNEVGYNYEPTFVEALGAQVLTETSIGSMIANKTRTKGSFDPDFDWSASYDKLPSNVKDVYGDLFTEAESEDHFNSIKDQIDFKEQNNEIIRQSGWMGVTAGFASQALEPLNLVPFGAYAKFAVKSKNMLTGAAQVALAGAASSSIQEAVIQDQDLTRTYGESASNIAASTLLSGILGGAFYKSLAKTDAKGLADLEDKVGKSMDLEESEIDLIKETGVVAEPKSLSSAAAMDTTLDEETIQSAAYAEKIFGFQDPGLRLLQSPAVTPRRWFQQMAEVPFKLKKNFKGIPTEEAAESRIRGSLEGRLATTLFDRTQAYKKYKMRLKGELVKNRLTESEFKTEVTKSIRRGMASDIPEVLEAASSVHKNIYKYIADEGMKVKNFFETDDIEALMKKPYVNRIYDTNKVLKDSPRFLTITKNWLMREAELSKSPTKKTALEDIQSGLDDESFFIRPAQSIRRNIIGARSMALHNKIGVSGEAKSLKGRKFTIDDLDIEDFLNNDIDELVATYAKSMLPRLELARRFGVEFLTDTFTDAKSLPVKEIRDEYAKMMALVEDQPKKLNKLLKREEKDINDLLSVRDRLLGTYGMTANPTSWMHRVPKMIKQINVLRMLGSAGIAAIPDVARLVGIKGFTFVFKDAIIPLARLASSSEGRAYFTKYKKELRAFNIGTELLMNSARERGLNGLTEDFAKNSKFERGLDMLSSKFMKHTLVPYWNTTFKTLAAMLIQNNVHGAVLKAVSGKIKPKDTAKLAELGISPSMAKIIDAQIKKHGENFKGLVLPNVADWDAEYAELGDIYASAISKEANRVIVTPGASTSPLWMSRGGLSLLGQFKSFAMASVQKTMIPMLQDRDFKTAQAATAMVGLGVLSSYLKAAVAGREVSDDPKQLLVEGVDRSGLTAWLFDANNMIEASSGNRFGLSKILGTEPMARYAQRGRIESVLGPTGKLAGDVTAVAGDLLSGDIRKSTTSKVRQMMPYQNLYGLRMILDKMEEEFNNSMGITKK
jgi:hypothetical protein